jgi:hypothetical protein
LLLCEAVEDSSFVARLICLDFLVGCLVSWLVIILVTIIVFDLAGFHSRYTTRFSVNWATPHGLSESSRAATYRISCEGHQGIPSRTLHNRRQEQNLARRGCVQNPHDKHPAVNRSGVPDPDDCGMANTFIVRSCFAGVQYPGVLCLPILKLHWIFAHGTRGVLPGFASLNLCTAR